MKLMNEITEGRKSLIRIRHCPFPFFFFLMNSTLLNIILFPDFPVFARRENLNIAYRVLNRYRI